MKAEDRGETNTQNFNGKSRGIPMQKFARNARALQWMKLIVKHLVGIVVKPFIDQNMLMHYYLEASGKADLF